MVKADKLIKAEMLLKLSGTTNICFMTDAADYGETRSAISQLPVGSFVILRAYNDADRADKARVLCDDAKAYGHLFLVAGDPVLARRVSADGVHMPEHMLAGIRPNLFGFRLVTAACHNRAALKRAKDMGVDLAIVSPVFETQSHPDVKPIGVHRLSRLIDGVSMPVAALGGVNAGTIGHLRGLKLASIAGMSGIVTGS